MSDDVPPPPGPPPPPAFTSAPKPERTALLGSIQNFNKGGLKKAKTVDKSGPVTSRQAASNDGSVSVSASVGKGAPMGGGPQPGFGNLFAGGVPKLRSASKAPTPTAAATRPTSTVQPSKKQSSFLVEVGSTPAKPATTPAPTKTAAAAPNNSRPPTTNFGAPKTGPGALPKSSPPPVAQKQSSAQNVSTLPKNPVTTPAPKPTTGTSFAQRPVSNKFDTKPPPAAAAPPQPRPTSIRPETPPSTGDLDELDNLIASFSPNSFIGAPVTAPTRQTRGDTAPSRKAPPEEINDLIAPPDTVDDSFSEPPSYAPPVAQNRDTFKPRDSVVNPRDSFKPRDSVVNPKPRDTYNFSNTTTTTTTTPSYTPAPTPTYSSSGPSCDRCRNAITSGRYVQALGKNYHQEHFTCSSCSSPLGTDFYASEIDSTPVCQNCYTRNYLTCAKCSRGIADKYMSDESGRRYHPDCYSQRCFKCARTIEGQCVKALDRDYHLQCFSCSRCNRQLDEDFYEDFGNPLCLSCGKNPPPANSYNNNSSPQYSVPARQCTSCGRGIDLNSSANVVTIKDKMWHDTCFNCSQCRTSLNNGSSSIQVRQKPDGSIVCDNCFSRNQANAGLSCSRCGRGITSRYMETEGTGQKYHQECFVCFSCNSSLGSDYYVGDSGPMCGNCAVVRCDECRQPMAGQYVNALGRKVHQHCFKCAGCRAPLVDDYYNVRNAPHCLNCASR